MTGNTEEIGISVNFTVLFVACSNVFLASQDALEVIVSVTE